MKVLLSIKPEHAENILAGTKRFEFRKAIFKNPNVKTVVIYATKPVGMVIGEFEVEHILSDRPSRIWAETGPFAGISRAFFREYFSGRHMAHAIGVRNATRYPEPQSLRAILQHGIAPQSFCYVT